MGWLNKKKDPLSERARALQAEIDRLEAQIQELQGEAGKAEPRLRSTTLPNRQTTSGPAASAPAPEQVFEDVDHQRLQSAPETSSQAHYNELGVRKYDLAAAWRRWRGQFRGTQPANPKFVALLAAGQIQGLRPLRYEKRVARRRFIVLAVILFLLLWGIIAMFVRR
jgi:hypothetical protein